MRYDEVAVPNIVRACAQLGIRSTFFVPGWCVERNPAMCETIVVGGHEVGLAGLHAPSAQQPDARRRTGLATAGLGRHRRAHRPTPPRLPAAHAAASAHMLDYLLSEGFLYDSPLANDHELSSSTFRRDRCLNSPTR